MEEDLVKRLTDFGLSVNQAKVYLSIVQSASTSVNTISKTTQIHRQDIYKILPKLEEMGLITKTIDRPITIEAIAVEEALSYIISTEQEKAKQRITRLKADLKALANAIKETQKQNETTTQEQEETQAIFLSTQRAIRNKLDVAYENARIKCDLVMNFEVMRWLPILRKRFQMLATNKVKTRLLINTIKSKGLVERTLEGMIPSGGDFTVKLTTGKVAVKPYIIIDCKEAYISTRKKITSVLSAILCIKCQNIISIYEENFEKAWNSSHALTIHPAKKENTTFQ